MSAGQPEEGLRRRGGRPSRRDDIVVAAAEAFAANGYHNTPLTVIAEELGMTPAGILHHFGSKENLLTEVLRHRDEVSLEFRAEGEEFLAHLVDTARRNERVAGLTQLYAVLSAESVTPDHPAQQYFRSRYDRVRVDVEDGLRKAAGLPPGSHHEQVALAARALVATMDGLQVQWLLDDRIGMADALEWVSESLVESLRRLP